MVSIREEEPEKDGQKPRAHESAPAPIGVGAREEPGANETGRDPPVPDTGSAPTVVRAREEGPGPPGGRVRDSNPCTTDLIPGYEEQYVWLPGLDKYTWQQVLRHNASSVMCLGLTSVGRGLVMTDGVPSPRTFRPGMTTASHSPMLPHSSVSSRPRTAMLTAAIVTTMTTVSILLMLLLHVMSFKISSFSLGVKNIRNLKFGIFVLRKLVEIQNCIIYFWLNKNFKI